MTDRKSQLKIDILKFGKGSKKKRKRHPAAGYYWGPLKDTPKHYDDTPPIREALSIISDE